MSELPFCKVCEEFNFTCDDCGLCKECDDCKESKDE
jgi:hypothetical protein